MQFRIKFCFKPLLWKWKLLFFVDILSNFNTWSCCRWHSNMIAISCWVGLFVALRISKLLSFYVKLSILCSTTTLWTVDKHPISLTPIKKSSVHIRITELVNFSRSPPLLTMTSIMVSIFHLLVKLISQDVQIPAQKRTQSINNGA